MKTFISSLGGRISQKINFVVNETTSNYSSSRFASSFTKNDHNFSKELTIDSTLVKRLLADQFPQFKDLPVRQVHPSGWDNRTFHLGDDMLVRMPSAERYAVQVEKEQNWLPILAPLLPVPIPKPLAMGNSAEYYPWKWSIYRWLEGETAASTKTVWRQL